MISKHTIYFEVLTVCAYKIIHVKEQQVKAALKYPPSEDKLPKALLKLSFWDDDVKNILLILRDSRFVFTKSFMLSDNILWTFSNANRVKQNFQTHF